MRPLVIASAHDLIARNCFQWATHGVSNLTTIALDFETDWETYEITITRAGSEETYRQIREISCLTCATVELIANLLADLPSGGPVLVIIPGGIELTSASVRLQQAIEMPASPLRHFRLARAITAVDTQVALQLLVGASDDFDVSQWMHTCRLVESPDWSDDSDATVSEVLVDDLLYADQVVLTGADTTGEDVVRQVAAHARIDHWGELEVGPWVSCSHDVDRALARVTDE